jgi:pimeloyl-ACP methyl ester carboxylesterase
MMTNWLLRGFGISLLIMLLIVVIGPFLIPVFPAADSLKLAGVVPAAKLVVIPQAGHVPHEEQPVAFMQVVIAFVRSLP